MIPYAILSGTLQLAGGRTEEIRVLDLSIEGFTFRLAGPAEELRGSAELHFYQGDTDSFRKVFLPELSVHADRETAYYTEYRVFSDDPAFREAARQLMAEYSRYAALKLAGDDGALQKELAGWPADRDEIFPDRFETWRHERLAGVTGDELWEDCLNRGLRMGIALDTPLRRQTWTELGHNYYIRTMAARQDFGRHPIARVKAQSVFIGNSFCPELGVGPDEMLRLRQKALEQEVEPVCVLAPVRHTMLTERQRFLDALAASLPRGGRQTLVVNDWGMLSLAARYDCFDLTLGLLLNKRRKDVRLAYAKSGSELGTNPAAAGFYTDFLRRRYGVRRVTWDSCGQPVPHSQLSSDLYLPFFHMNTGARCPMRNACEGMGSRSLHCRQHCRDHSFLYPAHMDMVGRGNSLFGLDADILRSGARMRQAMDAGVDRIVLEVL